MGSFKEACLTCRPTHDQIEQLQTKVTDLENLLHALSEAEPSGGATEALRIWRTNGAAVLPSSGRPNHSIRTINIPADEETGAEATGAFETPPGDQYIYDNTG